MVELLYSTHLVIAFFWLNTSLLNGDVSAFVSVMKRFIFVYFSLFSSPEQKSSTLPCQNKTVQ